MNVPWNNQEYHYGCSYNNSVLSYITECNVCGKNHVFNQVCQECTDKYRDSINMCAEGTSVTGAPSQDCAGMSDDMCDNKIEEQIYQYPSNNMWYYKCANRTGGQRLSITQCSMCEDGLVVNEYCNRCDYYDDRMGGPNQPKCEVDGTTVVPPPKCDDMLCMNKKDDDYEYGTAEGSNEFYACSGGFCKKKYCPMDYDYKTKVAKMMYFSKACGKYGRCERKYASVDTECSKTLPTVRPAQTVTMSPCPVADFCEDKRPGYYGDDTNDQMYYQCIRKKTCYVRYCPGEIKFDAEYGLCADMQSPYYLNKIKNPK